MIRCRHYQAKSGNNLVPVSVLMTKGHGFNISLGDTGTG
jgi:hypothetical protein